MPEDRRVLRRSAPAPASTWAYAEGPAQVADVYLPPPTAAVRRSTGPTVLLVHGGFWRPDIDRRHLRPMAAALAAEGTPTVLVEYARIPGDPDAGVADLTAALEALPAALAERGVVVVGHSAGGHLALLLAARAGPRLRGTLALAPVADLALAERLALDGDAVRAYLGGPAATRPDLDPRHCPPMVPVIVLHGRDDSLVPATLAESYCAVHPARLALAACAHFELIDPESAVWSTVLRELAALAPDSGIE